MRGEELKVDSATGNDSASGTPQKSGYFSRFIPKLPSFSPSLKSKKSKNDSPAPVDNLVRVIESHQVHKFQARDNELKATSSSGPTREQIATVTGASDVLRGNDDDGRSRGRMDDDVFGLGGEGSALLELLRQDQRLSGLIQGLE